MSSEALLIIDPQLDFCEGGSLAVQGANDDSERIANFIRENMGSLNQIYVTLDSHQRVHIAHPLFWENEEGEHPNPFTIISTEDVDTGVWKTSNEAHQEWGSSYVHALKVGGKFPLCIWPEHCLIGTPGHSVHPIINEALQEWAGRHNKTIVYVMKGSNPLTEHYSALRAEVEVPEDPATQTNQHFVRSLASHDRLYVCGEALSHCVAFTVRDYVEQVSEEQRRKVTLLSNCSSPVGGFEEAAADFLEEMREKGVDVV